MEDALRRSLRAAGENRPSATASISRSGTLNAPKEAAVAVILAGPSLELLFIRRASHPSDPWSGHMALPGGRRDPIDVNLQATALRETQEEVGVRLEEAEYLGHLAPLAAMASGGPVGLVVTPFVYLLTTRPTTHLNHEVAEVVWARLADLLSGALDTQMQLVHQGHQVTLPAWDVEGRIVWGMTRRIVGTLLGHCPLPSGPGIL